MKLAILIPAFNEEKTIEQVINSIPKTIEQINEINIIVVDDGSTDKTAENAKNASVMVISHHKNKGLGKAFQTGLEKALELKADILVTLDADNQFDPLEIPKIIKPIIENKAHFVTGCRFMKKEHLPKNIPFIKKWGNKQIAKIISWAVNQKLHDVSCGFRAYGKEAMLRLNLFGRFTYTQETILELAYQGINIVEIPVTVKYFKDRQSKVANSTIKYALNASQIIFRTVKDYRPLKFFGISGMIIFLIGLALDLFVLIHFTKNGTFSPYKIFGFAGAFLNAIGIMVIFIGILADLIDKIRLTQEKILYLEKKKQYER